MMTYSINLIKIFFAMDDHLFRIRKAEKIHQLWKTSAILILISMVVYGWMAYLGIGSDLVSKGAVGLTPEAYEASKFWFLIGRVIYAVFLALLILFVPSLLFYLLTEIPYQKLLIMQQTVLVVMLIERMIWIPLVLLIGLDWHVSPLSFGIIASYATDVPWAIYFFGAISLFQLWIIWFQVKFITSLVSMKKQWIWLNVILLHFLGWALTALITFADTYIVSGWFG